MSIELGLLAILLMYNGSESFSWGKITALSSFIFALMRQFNVIDVIYSSIEKLWKT